MRVKYRDLKKQKQAISEDSKTPLKEQKRALSDIYWYRQILLHMYNDNDAKHMRWAKESHQRLSGIPEPDNRPNDKEDQQDEEAKPVQKVTSAPSRPKSDRKERAKKQAAEEKRKEEARLKEEQAVLQEGVERVTKERQEEAGRVREEMERVTQELVEKQKGEDKLRTHMLDTTAPNHLAIFEMTRFGQGHTDTWFIFVYTFQDARGTVKHKCFMSFILNFPANVLDGTSNDGKSFQGVRKVQIPEINETSKEMSFGSIVNVGEEGGLQAEFERCEKEMRDKGFEHVYVTPIVLFSVSEPDVGVPKDAYRLSAHRTSSYVNVHEQKMRNANYSCDRYNAIMGLMPNVFDVTLDVKRFQKLTETFITPLFIFSPRDFHNNLVLVYMEKRQKTVTSEERKPTSAELKKRVQDVVTGKR